MQQAETSIDPARARRAENADAEALAANFRYDVAALQAEYDAYSHGKSASRSIQLPRYALALAIAKARQHVTTLVSDRDVLARMVAALKIRPDVLDDEPVALSYLTSKGFDFGDVVALSDRAIAEARG